MEEKLNTYLKKDTVDLVNLAHKISKKRMVSYINYNDDVKVEFDNAITSCYITKKTIRTIMEKYETAENFHSVDREGFYSSKALYSIAFSMNEVFEELLVSLSMSSKSMASFQLLREAVEYFSTFFVLSQVDDKAAKLYINHPNVLEFHILNEVESINNSCKSKRYRECIEEFSKYHSISYKKAEKIYSSSNGWCYKLMEGNSQEYITTKSIREYTLKKLDLDLMKVHNRVLKSVDMLMHPTPSYLLYLNNIDTREEPFLEFISKLVRTELSIMLGKLKQMMSSVTPEKELLDISISILDQINDDILVTEQMLERDYKVINSVGKYDVKGFYGGLNHLIENIRMNSSYRVNYYNYLHYTYFSSKKSRTTIREEIDVMYTFLELVAMNYSDFVITRLDKQVKYRNFSLIVNIVAVILHDMTVAYGLGKTKLFQKLYRLFVEYSAVADYLLCETDTVNKNFFDYGYVLLEQSYKVEEIEVQKVEDLLNKIKDRIGKDINVKDKRMRSFTSWTGKNVDGKLMVKSYRQINDLLHNKIEGSNIAKALYKESCAVMHGTLYSDSYLNVILCNDDFGFDYVRYIYLITERLIISLTNDMLDSKDNELVKSAKYILSTFEEHLSIFEENRIKDQQKYKG